MDWSHHSPGKPYVRAVDAVGSACNGGDVILLPPVRRDSVGGSGSISPEAYGGLHQVLLRFELPAPSRTTEEHADTLLCPAVA